jgi:hypothetical protein
MSGERYTYNTQDQHDLYDYLVIYAGIFIKSHTRIERNGISSVHGKLTFPRNNNIKFCHQTNNTNRT